MSYWVSDTIKVSDSKENLAKLKDILGKATEMSKEWHHNEINCLIVCAGIADQQAIEKELEDIDKRTFSCGRAWPYYADFEYKELNECGTDIIRIDTDGKWVGAPVANIIRQALPTALIQIDRFDEAYYYCSDDGNGSDRWTNDKEGKVFPMYFVYRNTRVARNNAPGDWTTEILLKTNDKSEAENFFKKESVNDIEDEIDTYMLDYPYYDIKPYKEE